VCKQLAGRFAREKAASAKDKQAEGRFEGARRQFEKLAQVMQENEGSGSGVSPHSMAATALMLGGALCDEGRYDAAVEKLTEALERFRVLHGNLSEDTASALSSLGMALRQQGKYELTAQRHREALRIRLEVLGPEHVSVAMSHNANGLLYQRTGMLKETLASYQEALRVVPEGVPGDARVVPGGAAGRTRRRTRRRSLRTRRRCASYQEALRVYRLRRGNENEDVATILMNMGVMG